MYLKRALILPVISVFSLLASANNVRYETNFAHPLEMKILQLGQVQFFGQLVSPEDPSLSLVAPFDNSQVISESRSLLGPKGQKIVGKLLISRSAFVVNRSLSDLAPKEDPLSLIKRALRHHQVTCDDVGCQVKTRVKIFIFGYDIDFEATQKFTELSGEEGEATPSLDGIGSFNAVSVQEAKNFSNFFRRGSSVSYYLKLDESHTLIVNYGLMQIKQTALNRIPSFVDIAEHIVSYAAQEALKMKRNLSSNRSPQSQEVLPGPRPVLDPAGDEHLVLRAQAVPQNIQKSLAKPKRTGSNYTFEPWVLVDPRAAETYQFFDPTKASIQGRENPLKVEPLTATLLQVIAQEARTGVSPFVSAFHQWAPETFEKFKGQGGTEVLFISKLLAAMAIGETHIYMPTGFAQDLQQWIVSQPLNSITLPEMFRASYRLNQGDVYRSLLTIQNLLAAHWRHKGRENLPATKRLRAITSGYNYAQDRFGTWYHLYGMILYGFVYGKEKAQFVGFTESLGAKFLSKGDRTQKNWLNLMGGVVGEGLRMGIENKDYLNLQESPEVFEESFYLNRTEDFRDRLQIPVSSGVRVQVQRVEEGLHRLNIQTSRILKNCQIDLMSDVGHGYLSFQKQSFWKVNLDGKIETDLSGTKKLKGFIHSCAGPKEPDLVFEISGPFF